jgi:deazaflavin-dependent oxidoreductase (nitroreductase family)
MAARRRDLKWWERALERFAASRPGGWYFVNVANRIDPPLLRLSRGRVSSGLGQPVLLLTTTGARSGQPRQTPLLHVTDGDDLVVIASRAGSSRHPSWYHNLRADPHVTVHARGRSGRYVAREAEGEERERLWAMANDLYAGYDAYQQRAGGRRIPVIVLRPDDAKAPRPEGPRPRPPAQP